MIKSLLIISSILFNNTLSIFTKLNIKVLIIANINDSIANVILSHLSDLYILFLININNAIKEKVNYLEVKP